MAQDLFNQNDFARELIIQAIQRLKQQGEEITPNSVAHEAKIPRSTIYENGDLLELIANQKSASASEPTKEPQIYVNKLEGRLKELEDAILSLNQENQALNKNLQTVWQQGFSAGVTQSNGRLGIDSDSQLNTGPFQLGGHLKGPADLSTPPTPMPPTPTPTNSQSPSSVGGLDRPKDFTAQSGEHFVAGARLTDAPTTSEGESRAREKRELDRSQSLFSDGIFNLARSGPYVASNFNPLIELSWKDLQTVYQSRPASLKDYGAAILAGAEEHSAPARQPVGTYAKDSVNPAGQKLSDLVGSNILSVLPSDQELAQIKNVEAVVYMSGEETIVEASEPVAGDFTWRAPGASAHLEAHLSAYQPDLTNAVVDLEALDIFDDVDVMAFADDQSDEDIKMDAANETIEKKQDSQKDTNEGAQADESEQALSQRQKSAAGQEDAGAPRAPSRSKFVGAGKAPQEPPTSNFMVRQIPAEIRKSCLILGLRPEELTVASVIDAWKKQIASPGVHPDQGGDTEAAVFLNTAKDTLMRWVDKQAPKLGKKFGSQNRESTKPPPESGTHK